MARSLRSRDVVGRTIVAYRPHVMWDREAATRYIHADPELVLDNGARITFTTEEGSGDYGVQPIYIPAPRKRVKK